MTPTRQRIVEAAVELFAGQGFARTTVGQIESAAGLTPRAGGFYKHFPSKSAVLEEALQARTERVDRVIAEVRSTPGDVAIFAHGHVLRILAARWIDLAPKDGRLFALDPAGVSVLGYEHTWAVLARWNETPINANEEDDDDIAAAL